MNRTSYQKNLWIRSTTELSEVGPKLTVGTVDMPILPTSTGDLKYVGNYQNSLNSV